jgi:succinate dehydrogenase / fumarate reductase cytochrome b subunit
LLGFVARCSLLFATLYARRTFRCIADPEISMPASRPKHLNLLEIRLPLPAFVSILHRISGAILFLLLPVILCLLASSLGSQQSFAQFKSWVGNPLAKIVLLGILWAYLHHFCAGIRHLVMDMHVGLELASARATSYAVFAISIALTAVIGGILW